MVTARVAAPCRATAMPMGGFFRVGTFLRREAREREKSRLGFYIFTIYDALVCLTACYPKKFGPRGIGHAGIMWNGLQCDIEDEGYAPPLIMPSRLFRARKQDARSARVATASPLWAIYCRFCVSVKFIRFILGVCILFCETSQSLLNEQMFYISSIFMASLSRWITE